MKDNSVHISKYYYRGIEIYNVLKNRIVLIDNKKVSLEDKKILALYLGLTYTEAEFNTLLKNYRMNNLKESERLTMILNTYSNDYNEITENLKKYFNSIYEYGKYLINEPIVKKYISSENNINLLNRSKERMIMK